MRSVGSKMTALSSALRTNVAYTGGHKESSYKGLIGNMVTDTLSKVGASTGHDNSYRIVQLTMVYDSGMRSTDRILFSHRLHICVMTHQNPLIGDRWRRESIE